MSYDIYLKDPVTNDVCQLESAHFMRGGTYAVGGTQEAWLNITYNYAPYYYEATDGDPRFAHDEISAYYADGTTGPLQTEYGIRGIYGKTGAESIPMLQNMIDRIEAKYRPDGKEWISTDREETVYYSKLTLQRLEPYKVFTGQTDPYDSYKDTITVNEGTTDDYWQPTAANAIRPLHQLIALAQMRPDGIWAGD